MKIIRREVICPKCKTSYFNSILASYSSRFESAASDFMKNNKDYVLCEKCGMNLIPKELIKDYDSEGIYIGKEEIMSISEDIDPFDVYLKTLKITEDFLRCNVNGKVELSSIIEENDNQGEAFMIVKGKVEDREFKLMKVKVDEYHISSMAGRKNEFIKIGFKGEINSFIKSIYEYLFIDDCSSLYNKRDEGKVVLRILE